MKRLLPWLLALLFAAPALAVTNAHPTLWHVKGPKGDAYILGSIHVLPPDVNWRTPEIEAALKKSDIYAFEVSTDDRSMVKMRDAVVSKGFLPGGQSLRAMLHKDLLPDYDAAVAANGIDPKLVDHQRPWLAGLTMVLASTAKLHFDPSNGADAVLAREAQALGKPTRYLETMDQQIAVIAPDDPALEMSEFESSLKDLRDVAGEVEPMLAAWSTGDQKKLDDLVNGDMDKASREALLDNRNADWIPRIAEWLHEPHTYFITVGAGHLTGPHGVPNLLRQAGYKVTGP